MIFLFTDFGHEGPYMGEMEAEILRRAPGVPVVRLMVDAPAFRPDLASYLLAALAKRFRPGDVCVAVVDPGVGTEREAIAFEADGVWFVGPDNGLFEPILRGALDLRTFRIAWRPPRLSASFHGRDLFAPVAARIARGDLSALEPHEPTRHPDRPDALAAVVYVDRYGNAWTGLPGEEVPRGARIRAGGRELAYAETFGRVPPGEPFWYVNSAGLVEIAVNAGSAAVLLGLAPGVPVEMVEPESGARGEDGEAAES